jgi:hypothetical protein
MKNSIDKLKSAIEKINLTLAARGLTAPPPEMTFETQPFNKKGACCYIHDTLGKQCIGVTQEVCIRKKANAGLYEGDFREGQTCDTVSGGKCPREATGTNASTDMVSARKQAAPYLLADPAKDIYDGRIERMDPTVTCDACVDGNNAPPCSCLRAFYGYEAVMPQGCPSISEMEAPAFTAATWPGLKTAYITRLADRILAGGGTHVGVFQACHAEPPRRGTRGDSTLCALVRHCMEDRRAGNPCTGPLYDGITEVPNVPFVVKYMTDNGCIGAASGSSCTPGGPGEANVCADNQPVGSPGWSAQNCAQRDFGNCVPGPAGLSPQFITNDQELKIPANEEQKKAAGELIKQLKLFARK